MRVAGRGGTEQSRVAVWDMLVCPQATQASRCLAGGTRASSSQREELECSGVAMQVTGLVPAKTLCDWLAPAARADSGARSLRSRSWRGWTYKGLGVGWGVWSRLLQLLRVCWYPGLVEAPPHLCLYAHKVLCVRVNVCVMLDQGCPNASFYLDNPCKELTSN